MSKALDLNMFANQTLDIKLLDGSTLHIKKPTQAMVIRLMALKNTTEDTAFDAMDELIDCIFNSNLDGKHFDKEWYDNNLDFAMKTAIIQAYSEFINELAANPN